MLAKETRGYRIREDMSLPLKRKRNNDRRKCDADGEVCIVNFRTRAPLLTGQREDAPPRKKLRKTPRANARSSP